MYIIICLSFSLYLASYLVLISFHFCSSVYLIGRCNVSRALKRRPSSCASSVSAACKFGYSCLFTGARSSSSLSGSISSAMRLDLGGTYSHEASDRFPPKSKSKSLSPSSLLSCCCALSRSCSSCSSLMVSYVLLPWEDGALSLGRAPVAEAAAAGVFSG